MRYVIFGIVSLIIVGLLATTHSWALMWFLYLALVLVLLAIRVTARPAKVLVANRRLSQLNAYVGQPVTVNVNVSWESGSGPGWVLVQDTLPTLIDSLAPCGQLTTIGTDTASSFSYRISGQRRGFYPIGPLKIEIGDLFGLARSTATSNDTIYITVYPRVQPVPPVRIPSNRPIGDASSTKRIYEDSTRIVGVRDYVPGDTQSKIHWKSTAHVGSLVTKMCEPSTSVEVNILLNLHLGDYPPGDEVVELACTTAASVAAGLLAEKNQVGLQTNGYDPIWQFKRPPTPFGFSLRPGKGALQSEAILSTLGRLQPALTPTLGKYLTDIHALLPWTASTLLITPALSAESLIVLESLKNGGFELAVIIVGTGEAAETSRIRAASLNIPVAIVKSEKHLGQLEFWQPGRN
jgi:uncharacterized protein (DUF58 family)